MAHRSLGSWNIVRGGSITAVDDSGVVQTAQIQLSYLEKFSDRPVLQLFGFASNPPIGSDAVLYSPTGDPSAGIILGTNDQSSRPVNLPSGGSRQYDQGGRQVLLDNTGLIQLFAPGETLHKLVTDLFMALFNMHTHTSESPGSPTSAPLQQMTDAHLTTATRAGT